MKISKIYTDLLKYNLSLKYNVLGQSWIAVASEGLTKNVKNREKMSFSESQPGIIKAEVDLWGKLRGDSQGFCRDYHHEIASRLDFQQASL